MKVNFIIDSLFERIGELKLIEKEIPRDSTDFTNKLHLYKCKKYGKTGKNIIEIGVYFKFIIGNKISHDKEFKIVLDIYPTREERYFGKYDSSELNSILSTYNIDDIEVVCNKIIDSVKHDYF